jgi:transcriptional regulator with XRE-family HTH domain
MPKRTPGRTIYDEADLAARIAHERATRGWSLEGLAARMADAGCPVQATAINKVEKTDPKTATRRRVPIAELLAYAAVFGLTLEEMLQPPDHITTHEFALLVRTWDQAKVKAVAAAQEEGEAWAAVKTYAEAHADEYDTLRMVTRVYAETRGYRHPDLSGDWLLANATDDETLLDDVVARARAKRDQDKEG